MTRKGDNMMLEKYMVNDILSQVNSSLTNYATVISQASCPEFRKMIQDTRNSCETFQYDLYKVIWPQSSWHLEFSKREQY